jgi:hypothetical protein
VPPISRNKPVCPRCKKQHWNFVQCDAADDRNRVEESNERRRAEFIVRRPREGYLEFGDRLDPATVRMGRTTMAVKREPGQRIGQFKERTD